MTRRLVMPVMLVAAVQAYAAGALEAQETGNVRAADAMQAQSGGRYAAANCSASKTGHFKVSSGATYLKTGIEASEPANQTRLLESGERVIRDAITQNGQDKNAAAWYYLGRIELHRGNLASADSAFTKAEALAPDCKEQIAIHRRTAWVPLVNAGLDFTKQENNDSAFALYRQANQIFRDAPTAFASMGITFANQKQTDSAIVYFKQAVAAAGTDPKYAEDKSAITRNLAAMLQRANRHDEAIAALGEYLRTTPDDAEAKKALAYSYRAIGKNEQAAALEKEVLGSADEPGAAGEGGVSAGDVFSIGVNLYKEKKYADAAAAFEKVVATEPYNRDALYNLAQSYFSAGDGRNLVKIATRLTELEPLGEQAITLLSKGYELTKQQEKNIATVTVLFEAPMVVEVGAFTRTTDGATFTATAKGREGKNAKTGKPIPPAAKTVTVEFVDNAGAAVATQEVPVPALPPGQSHPIAAQAQGAGIVGWRYRVK